MTNARAATRWLLLAIALTVYGAVIVYSDPLLLGIFLFFALWPIGLACVLSVIVFFYALATRRPLFPPRLFLGVSFGVAIIAVGAVPLNEWAQEQAVTAAKAYPGRIAPLLEEYHRQHGSYPDQLDQLPSHPRVPRLLRTSYGYKSFGNTYGFSFGQPGGVIDVWRYDSQTHQWHYRT